MKRVFIGEKVLKNNDSIAAKNRRLLNEKGVFTINLLGSPGSGKTSVLEQIIKLTKEKINMAVIEGDLYTTKDAERIEKQGVDVVQVNTGGACHLDASMVEEALEEINVNQLHLLVIENVGNLVCPASFDLSEDMKVIVMSVTEGNDKPLKYPAMFQRSKILILNKMDMIKLTNFDMEEFYTDAKSINGDIKIFEVSCTTGEGIDNLCDYIKSMINQK
ncbi:hydrogenase nickel incorporation protein HypB [Clostridium pascui]|uniref:hydrogenase nickel incorporation protein HypB n=1 Tax=Clostridium pascui TaxID=46609 RepID=UPI001958330C|nr:hydrogenase nickel incorporation protein HypB [Clostridium pascui]MBM7870433.1 hydrogenase nickel incorporation protein HypB [Clostridium pascui]